MFVLDMHTHSLASGHATHNTITEMAKEAARKGLSLLGISDHGPATPLSGTASYFRSLKLAPRSRAGIMVLYGAEANILDNKGTLDLDHSILSDLDYVIASMHLPNRPPESMNSNTEAYIEAMKHPEVKIIGHCDDTRYPVDFEALLKASIQYHTLLEINNASLAPGSYRGNTEANNLELLSLCKQYGQPVLLASDSHGTAHIGDFSYAMQLVEKVNFPHSLILNYDREAFLKFLSNF